MTTIKVKGTVHQFMRVIPTERIFPDPDQPRKEFDQDKLEELKMSIRTLGQTDPIKVRVHPEDVDKPAKEKRYFIIGGERRWKCCTALGIATMDAIVQKVGADNGYMVAVVDNLARVGYTSVESGNALIKTMNLMKCDDVEAARYLGKRAAWAKKHAILMQLNPRVLTLMQAPIPERKRLKLDIAILLLPFPWEEQYAMANNFFEKQTSVIEAKHAIKKRLSNKGFSKTVSQSGHTRRHLKVFLKNTNVKLDLLIDKPESEIAIAFKGNESAATKAIEDIDTLMKNFQFLRDRLSLISQK